MFRAGPGAHNGNPMPWEAEAGGSQVQGQPGLHSKKLSEKPNKKPNRNIFNQGIYILMYK
jgi:hypothetical protein